MYDSIDTQNLQAHASQRMRLSLKISWRELMLFRRLHRCTTKEKAKESTYLKGRNFGGKKIWRLNSAKFNGYWSSAKFTNFPKFVEVSFYLIQDIAKQFDSGVFDKYFSQKLHVFHTINLVQNYYFFFWCLFDPSGLF